jgi:hypothetical protein
MGVSARVFSCVVQAMDVDGEGGGPGGAPMDAGAPRGDVDAPLIIKRRALKRDAPDEQRDLDEPLIVRLRFLKHAAAQHSVAEGATVEQGDTKRAKIEPI